MRLKLERPLTEKDYGRRRVISKFLWFPKEINHEIRWLEKAMIEQKVTFRMVDSPDSVYCDYRIPQIKQHYWQNSKWIDPPIKLI